MYFSQNLLLFVCTVYWNGCETNDFLQVLIYALQLLFPGLKTRPFMITNIYCENTVYKSVWFICFLLMFSICTKIL